jgi:hypothetical protein
MGSAQDVVASDPWAVAFDRDRRRLAELEAENRDLRRALWIMVRAADTHCVLLADSAQAAFDEEGDRLVTWRLGDGMMMLAEARGEWGDTAEPVAGSGRDRLRLLMGDEWPGLAGESP